MIMYKPQSSHLSRADEVISNNESTKSIKKGDQQHKSTEIGMHLTDEPYSKEVFDNFQVESIFDHDKEDDGAVITHQYDELRRLRMLHELVRHIEKNPKERAFKRFTTKTGKERLHVTSLGTTCFALLNSHLPQRDSHLRLSEEIELLLEVAETLGFPLKCNSITQEVASWMSGTADLKEFLGKPVVEIINTFILKLGEKLRSQQFRGRRYERLRQANENHGSACSYIESLFGRYKRLLVIRIDLHFAKEDAPRPDNKEIARLLQRFLNNFRHTRYGSKKVGYVWKLEDGHSRGPHVHLLLLLNASEHQKHAFIAEEIGRFWEENITNGKGYFISCHRKGFEYRFPALGVVERYDEEKRQNIYRILRYFTKAEQFMKIAGNRCFGKGKPAPVRPNRLGRPPSTSYSATQTV